MALNTYQTRELEEVTQEIAQLEHRLKVSNGLGDNHSSNGGSFGFANNIEWTKRLSLLRMRRNQLEGWRDRVSDNLAPSLGISTVNYLG